MAQYEIEGADLLLFLTEEYRDLLQNLAGQLVELLTDGAQEPGADHTGSGEPRGAQETIDSRARLDPNDPFSQWEAEFHGSESEPEPLTDPALQRLFPNPYPHDLEAASDHRRFAEPQQRQEKLDDLMVLARGAQRNPVRITPAEQTPWLRSLNAIRLVLASRLGVEDEESMEYLHQLPEDDPRSMMTAVMEWLAGLQYLIIEVAPKP